MVVSALGNAYGKSKKHHLLGARLHDQAANMANLLADRALRRGDEVDNQRWLRTAGRQRSRAYQARQSPLPPE